MANHRKLGRPTDQRVAMLRSLTTDLIWHGKITTTEARAKEVRKMAEKLITLAIHEFDKTETVEKSVFNEKHQTKEVTVTNDSASKLHARRLIMQTLYNYAEPKKDKETKSAYKERTAALATRSWRSCSARSRPSTRSAAKRRVPRAATPAS